MKNSDFQNRLNEAMNIRKMKAVELVERTGFTKSKISQYVNGVYQPKPEALFTLAKVLDVDEGWLMGYDCKMDKELNLEADKETSREEQLLIAIHSAFGGQAVILVKAFVRLNMDGRTKLITYVNDLLENPKNTEQKGEKLLDA